MKESAYLALDAAPEGPRKQGARTASRTAFIIELKHYLKNNFGQKFNQIVATIVNTALNLKDDVVSEDMVRKA